MIQSIEVWDFECHEHSLIDCLSEGLNLIHGESDSGKTSLVRALKLAAYNIFDQKSVRVGAKNCQVKVTTERGYVHVTRGKDNMWDTCRAGGKVQHFTKIGKNILDDAAEIIGLHLIELGDLSLPVNVMDQDEAHFMLSELGGSDASGSARAQIVDEISGLSGIEGVIKDVSLDRHRLGREVKVMEDQANEIRSGMHNQAELDAEQKLLDKATALMVDVKECRDAIEGLADIFESHATTSDELDAQKAEFAALPNTKMVGAYIAKSKQDFEKAQQLEGIKIRWYVVKEDIVEAEAGIKATEVGDAPQLIAQAEKAFSKARRAKLVLNQYQEAQKEVKRVTVEHLGIDEVSAREFLKVATELRQKADKAMASAENLADLFDEVDQLSMTEAAIELELTEAEAESNKVLASIKVCPLSQQPISKECFRGVKFPVLEKP